MMFWNHRRVRGWHGIREVFYDAAGVSFGHCPSKWTDFLRHPSWLWRALRKPVIEDCPTQEEDW